MGSAKDIIVKPIKAHAARQIVEKYHYSGKATQNSQIHLGVFIGGKLDGVMQFGPPIDRRKLLPLVRYSKWGDMIELNRMAFGPSLPKNSESRAISIAFKIFKKTYPQIKWVVSFADGTQCGDGTIYRASGFKLTAINKNTTLKKLADGTIAASHGTSKKDFSNATTMQGFQLRYIYFIDKSCEELLTVPTISFSKIDEMGAGMYKGERVTLKSRRDKLGDGCSQQHSGGATPTVTLHSKAMP